GATEDAASCAIQRCSGGTVSVSPNPTSLSPLVPATRHMLGRVLAWLERLAPRPLGAVVLFGLGLASYAVQAIAWPLKGGRDLDEYLLAYVQLFDHHVLLPWSLLFRTPVTPLVSGISLDVAGGRLAEPLAAVIFAASVV